MRLSIFCIILTAFTSLLGCQKVLFVAQRDGHDQIYTMTADGGSQSNISNDAFYDHFPDVSADATQIVFSSLRNGPGENIYVMATDGSGVVALTNGSGQRTQPRWGAHDRIAFQFPAYRAGTQIWSAYYDESLGPYPAPAMGTWQLVFLGLGLMSVASLMLVRARTTMAG